MEICVFVRQNRFSQAIIFPASTPPAGNRSAYEAFCLGLSIPAEYSVRLYCQILLFFIPLFTCSCVRIQICPRQFDVWFLVLRALPETRSYMLSPGVTHLHCTTPALAGGARERSAVQVSGGTRRSGGYDT